MTDTTSKNLAVTLRVVVYTAPVGSTDADKLDLLRVVGIQTQ
ncbi:hypothetical protein [Mycolicibacterium mengxianglii]|nr:hypothetical protein [Mycolicibacterium mengxianglii]